VMLSFFCNGGAGQIVPEEIMSGSMATISRVLRRDFQTLWRAIFTATMSEALEEMGEQGELDVFAWTKRVAHKAGTKINGGCLCWTHFDYVQGFELGLAMKPWSQSYFIDWLSCLS
jgi:hypothetical protein